MKQLKFLAIAATALLAAATLSFTSCSDDDDDDGGSTTTFNVSPSSLTFDAAGGTKTLTVTGDWDKNPTTEADWLTLTTADNKITVVATAYTETTAPRTTTITVGSKTVNVSQAAYVVPTPSVTANPSSLSFNASGNSAQTVYVTLSNVEGSWTATASETWVTVTPSADSFTVNVGDNTADGSRTATITVKVTDDVKTTVSVSQKGVSSSSGLTFNGTYNATSTSLFFGTYDFPSTFSGALVTDETQSGQDFYGDGTLWNVQLMYNFADMLTNEYAIAFLSDNDNRIVLTSQYTSISYDGNPTYMIYIWGDSSGGSDIVVPTAYDSATNTIDFTAVGEENGGEYECYVCLAYVENNMWTIISDGYAGLKLVYNETRSSYSFAPNSNLSMSYTDKLNVKGQTRPISTEKLSVFAK